MTAARRSPLKSRQVGYSFSAPIRRAGNREARIPAAVVWWLREAAPDCLVFAVPNDGLYSKSEASRRKWIGVLAGVPDLAIIDATGCPAFFEIKPPGEYPSSNQRTVMSSLAARGVRVAVVRSLEEAQAIAFAWGLIEQEAA